MNKIQNIQIEKILDEGIQKFTNDNNYFSSNYRNINNTYFSRNDIKNYNSSYKILKTFNHSLNKNKNNTIRKKSFNKPNKIQKNPKSTTYFLSRNNNNTHKYILTNNKTMENRFGILSFGSASKKTRNRKNSNGNLMQNNTCPFMKRENSKKTSIRKKSINKRNKSVGQITPMNKSVIKKHNRKDNVVEQE